MIIVPGYGPRSRVAIVGEAPGRREADALRPFVGPSGQIQADYLRRFGVDVRDCYLDNVSRIYQDGNPDPLPDELEWGAPVLREALDKVQPTLVLAVGRYAMRQFLGADARLDVCYGRPFEPGSFAVDEGDYRASIATVPPSVTAIVPLYHPATAMRNPDLFGVVREGYRRAAGYARQALAGQTVTPVTDTIGGDVDYRDVTGSELADILSISDSEFIAIDTEGIPSAPWSIQVSCTPGTGYVLRVRQPDFKVGIAAVQAYIRTRTLITHACSTPVRGFYEHVMCRAMGLDLHEARRAVDTMFMLYLMRLESRSLKRASRRWAGMIQTEYESLLEQTNYQHAIAYLQCVSEIRDWAPIAPTIKYCGDGTVERKKPQSPDKKARRILADIAAGKTNKDGLPVDPRKRWFGKDATTTVRAVAERIGPMPSATFDDIPLADAVAYAAADPDATLRLFFALEPELESLGMSGLVNTSTGSLPLVEQMQANGMFASPNHFHNLSDRIQDSITETLRQLRQYTGGRPINVRSSKQIAAFLMRRGVQISQRTATGQPSTSRKALLHLRKQEPTIDLIFEARELFHLRSSFCAPILARIDAARAESDYETDGADETDGTDGTTSEQPAAPEAGLVSATFAHDSDTPVFETTAIDRAVAPDVDVSPSSDLVRIRCNFNPCGTVSRRLSTSAPNMLAIPRRTEMGRQIRAGFRASVPGNVILGYDLSQIEMRCMAELSGDPELLTLFAEGRDIHRETAATVFRVPLSAVTSEQRTAIKTTGFGIIYGIYDEALAIQLRMLGLTGWTPEECGKLRVGWLSKFSGVRSYIDRTVEAAMRDEYVVDPWGMRRYLPGVRARDYSARSEAGRQAVSLCVQGYAQGMIQNAMAWLYSEFKRLRTEEGITVLPCMQIHDELLVETARRWADRVGKVLLEALTQHTGARTRVPILADGHTAETWGDLKD